MSTPTLVHLLVVTILIVADLIYILWTMRFKPEQLENSPEVNMIWFFLATLLLRAYYPVAFYGASPWVDLLLLLGFGICMEARERALRSVQNRNSTTEPVAT